MKRKTIYWIIGIAIVLWYWQKNKLQKNAPIGGNCQSSLGMKAIEFEGKCEVCPETVFANGVVALEPYIWECQKRKLTAIAMP